MPTLTADAPRIRLLSTVTGTQLQGLAAVLADCVDGGASVNNVLCQLQADQLQVPVRRPRVRETTGLGAAFLAGLATGVWSSTEELRATWQLDRAFEPGTRDDAAHARWRVAVDRSKGWARL